MSNERKPLPENVQHWGQLKNSEYIGHWDLTPDKKFKVTIDDIFQEEVTNPGNFKKELKTVLSFTKGSKKLILNVENMKAIASHHGDNPKEWKGKDVELFRATTLMKGKSVECVRVLPKDGIKKQVG